MWGFLASKIKVTPQMEETLEEGGPKILPLDLSDDAGKGLICSDEKRGYVAHDQINGSLSSEEVKSEPIEDMAKFSEMGVNVVEIKEAELDVEVAAHGEAEEEAEGENELVEVQQRPVPAK